MTQPTLINLHPNEYSQELPYCSFAVYLDRCVGRCNTSNDFQPEAHICAPFSCYVILRDYLPTAMVYPFPA